MGLRDEVCNSLTSITADAVQMNVPSPCKGEGCSELQHQERSRSVTGAGISSVKGGALRRRILLRR